MMHEVFEDGPYVRRSPFDDCLCCATGKKWRRFEGSGAAEDLVTTINGLGWSRDLFADSIEPHPGTSAGTLIVTQVVHRNLFVLMFLRRVNLQADLAAREAGAPGRPP